jgi:hypothetical protein
VNKIARLIEIYHGSNYEYEHIEDNLIYSYSDN